MVYLTNNPMAAVNNKCGDENAKPSTLSIFSYSLQLQVVLGPSGDHHNRTGREEHAEEEFKAAVHRKAEKRRRNGKRSSSEMDHCNTQQKGSLLDGRGVAKSLPHRMGEERGTFRIIYIYMLVMGMATIFKVPSSHLGHAVSGREYMPNQSINFNICGRVCSSLILFVGRRVYVRTVLQL